MAIMTHALPIWAKGCEEEINCRLQFRLTGVRKKAAKLYVATSGVYQLFINGKFVHCGPARAGRGHFRVDIIDLTPYADGRSTVIAADVAGYNTENYYIMRQTPFFQAEVVDAQGNPLSYTGDGKWEIIRTPGYMQKVGRYSPQRTFVEAYRLSPGYNDFKRGRATDDLRLEAVTLPGGTLLERGVPFPEYESCRARLYDGGTFTVEPPAEYRAHHPDGNPHYHAFSPDEMEFCAMRAAQELHFTAAPGLHDRHIAAGQYCMYRLPHNASGFLSLRLTCSEPTVLSCLFDEILDDEGQIAFYRMWTVNHLRWELQPGTYQLLAFEPYTMRYINLAVLSGRCSVSQVSLVEYKHPSLEVDLSVLSGDAAMQSIAEAAIETFRQNAVDVFTDCPSRERAGWLCDSFFIARTAFTLTGSTAQEKLFLENFLHEKQFEQLPDGVFPMCYPADHIDGNFIPNWTLWLVLQLYEYLQRSDDRDLIDRYRDRVYDLLRFFANYENEDGLLEDLPAWVFVDWSESNGLVQGVSYPSNMLYSAALQAAGRLYGDSLLLHRSARVATVTAQQSFDGKFFRDHAIRRDGRLFLCEDYTEACQAYAFFFGLATPETHSRLYKLLKNDLGPRREEDAFPAMPRAGAFIGHYLRLEVLKQNGEHNRVRSDLRSMLLPMIEATGTLWEKIDLYCSCCHGFAAYAICWILGAPQPTMVSPASLRTDEIVSLTEVERRMLQLFGALSLGQQRNLLHIMEHCSGTQKMDAILYLLAQDKGTPEE